MINTSEIRSTNRSHHSLKKSYSNTTVFLNIKGVKLEFRATYGVKQGNNLAPILFVIFLNAVIETLEKKSTFMKPDFRWMSNPKKNDETRGQLKNISW